MLFDLRRRAVRFGTTVREGMIPLLRLTRSSLTTTLLCLTLCAGHILGANLEVVLRDSQNLPISGAQLQLSRSPDKTPAQSAETNLEGRALFQNLEPATYQLIVSKDGFASVTKSNLILGTGPGVTSTQDLTVAITLVPAAPRTEHIDVTDQADAVQSGGSAPATVDPHVVRELPGRPATVTDSLPLIPGVLRSPGGGLIISAAGEHRSALLVNSADVTDPATGQFGLTVPIDVVETLNVFQTPFLAEYGRFSAGLVSVETRRGGDKWKWDLNDPFPDFRIRSYHIRGIRDATPRLNVEGPLIEGKLYFSEGINYEIRRTEVYELPFPYNQKKQEGLNSFAQVDWIASSKQLVTATLHVAPQRLDYVNMDYFNPQPTTPEGRTQNYTGTLADKLTIFGGVLDNTLSYTRFDARVWGQGTQDFTISPEGNSGSYFAQQDRQASRLSWSPTFSAAPVHWFGTHNIKAGAYLAGSEDTGQVTERPINLLDGNNQLLERITFTGGQAFHMSDREEAFFVQDHWLVTPKLAFDAGLRTESQELSESLRVAPRVGVAWTPFERTGTTVRAGFGLFYDRLPLNVYSFANYPTQVISYVNPLEQIAYSNQLGVITATSPFVIHAQTPGDFSPRSATASMQIEQPVNSHLKLRLGYVHSQSAGIVVLNQIAPDPTTGAGGVNLLSGTGQSRYQQFEVSARVRWSDKRQLFFSYVRSSARGDTNDFSTYLGTFAQPILRSNQFGYLPTDMPNRFLAWGLVQLPWSFRVAPLIEYRTGFPYLTTDAAQNWVGIPYGSRFPDFFSVDARFSKDIAINPKYKVRLSVNSYNLTNHFNPEAIHANIADPVYGHFFGQRGRHFTADFDILF